MLPGDCEMRFKSMELSYTIHDTKAGDKLHQSSIIAISYLTLETKHMLRSCVRAVTDGWSRSGHFWPSSINKPVKLTQLTHVAELCVAESHWQSETLTRPQGHKAQGTRPRPWDGNLARPRPWWHQRREQADVQPRCHFADVQLTHMYISRSPLA